MSRLLVHIYKQVSKTCLGYLYRHRGRTGQWWISPVTNPQKWWTSIQNPPVNCSQIYQAMNTIEHMLPSTEYSREKCHFCCIWINFVPVWLRVLNKNDQIQPHWSSQPGHETRSMTANGSHLIWLISNKYSLLCYVHGIKQVTYIV
jgi:hypothetical protein